MHHLREKVALLLLGLTTAAMADSTAFTFASQAAKGGTLVTANSNRTVARLITVSNKDITVSALGAEIRDGSEGSTTVGIFNASTSVLVASAVVTTADTAVGIYRYTSISPVVLSKNTNYYISAFIPNGQKYYQNVGAATVPSTLIDQTTTVVNGDTMLPGGTPSSPRSYVANMLFDMSRSMGPITGLPSEMVPTFRGRWGVNPIASVSTANISATVSDSSNLPLADVPVTFEVLSDTTVSGHAHSGVVYPWFGANDDDGRPLSEAVGAAAKGGSLLTSITVNTNASGVASVAFTAPEVAGTYQVRAVTTGQVNTSTWASVNVKVDGLAPIPASPTNNYAIFGDPNVHVDNTYATVDLATKIEQAGVLYRQYQLDEAKGLPNLMQQLKDSGYTGKYFVNAVRIRLGHASLPWGGMFDLRQDFTTATGHSLHGSGTEVDVYVNPMLRKLSTGNFKPERIVISDAEYDPAATVAQNQIIRQSNLLRARLLVQALIDAGFSVSNGGETDGQRLKLHCKLN